MKKAIDFEAMSKRIRKRRGVALKKEADRLLEQSKHLEYEAREVREAIKSNLTLSRRERNKLLAEFDKECTDIFSECMTFMQSLVNRSKDHTLAEIKPFKK
jgi:hypothetical protein